MFLSELFSPSPAPPPSGTGGLVSSETQSVTEQPFGMDFPDCLFQDLPEVCDVGMGDEAWASTTDVAVATSPFEVVSATCQATTSTRDAAAGADDRQWVDVGVGCETWTSATDVAVST